ncbi:hypothetical protein Droror1_Dr00017295 [Drosera rotundifolia]
MNLVHVLLILTSLNRTVVVTQFCSSCIKLSGGGIPRLKTKVWLYTRGIGDDDLCTFCRLIPEERDHLFVSCEYTARIRTMSSVWGKLQLGCFREINLYTLLLLTRLTF